MKKPLKKKKNKKKGGGKRQTPTTQSTKIAFWALLPFNHSAALRPFWTHFHRARRCIVRGALLRHAVAAEAALAAAKIAVAKIAVAVHHATVAAEPIIAYLVLRHPLARGTDKAEIVHKQRAENNKDHERLDQEDNPPVI